MTLLATGDLELTLAAVAGEAAQRTRGHPAALPVHHLATTSESRAPVATVPKTDAPPLTSSERRKLLGKPSTWAFGFTLDYLAMLIGRWPDEEIRLLVRAVRAGCVETVDVLHNCIPSSVWALSTLQAHPTDGRMLMVPMREKGGNDIEPLFKRDHVLDLMPVCSSLAAALEGHYEKTLADLPAELRRWVERAFVLITWDNLSAYQRPAHERRKIALQWDTMHDLAPAVALDRKAGIDSAVRVADLERQIREWQMIAVPTALDLAKKETRLAELRQELAREMHRFTLNDPTIPTDPPSTAADAASTDQLRGVRSPRRGGSARIDDDAHVAKYLQERIDAPGLAVRAFVLAHDNEIPGANVDAKVRRIQMRVSKAQ